MSAQTTDRTTTESEQGRRNTQAEDLARSGRSGDSARGSGRRITEAWRFQYDRKRTHERYPTTLHNNPLTDQVHVRTDAMQWAWVQSQGCMSRRRAPRQHQRTQNTSADTRTAFGHTLGVAEHKQGPERYLPQDEPK